MEFFAQCEGDVGLAWEYRSGWYKKVSIGADGVKKRISVRMVQKKLSDIVVKQSPVVLRRMGSNHRPSGYEPDELPLLYSAL